MIRDVNDARSAKRPIYQKRVGVSVAGAVRWREQFGGRSTEQRSGRSGSLIGAFQWEEAVWWEEQFVGRVVACWAIACSLEGLPSLFLIYPESGIFESLTLKLMVNGLFVR